MLLYNNGHHGMDPKVGEKMLSTFKSNNANEISQFILTLQSCGYLNALHKLSTPLMCAVQLNCVTAVGLLLKKPEVKAEINYTNYNSFYKSDVSALSLAVRFGHFDIAKLLIANDAAVTEDVKKEAKGGNRHIIALLADPAAMENLRANPHTVMLAPTTSSATSESSCAIS